MLGDTLKMSGERGFSQMRLALEGLSAPQVYAVPVQVGGEEYLHTDGSIYGIALHSATCKLVYASIAFRGTEIRWRDCADELASFEPDWEGAMRFIEKSHEYWMDSWRDLSDSQLMDICPTNYAEDMPAAEWIDIVHHHDSYHAGQIGLLRASALEPRDAPESVAADIRQYCRDSKHW